jgi:hypothetical protein
MENNKNLLCYNRTYSKVNKLTRIKRALIFYYFRFSVIDLIQKSTNELGQKCQLFFHFLFSVNILSVLLQQSKRELASHTSSYFFIVATTQKEKV